MGNELSLHCRSKQSSLNSFWVIKAIRSWRRIGLWVAARLFLIQVLIGELPWLGGCTSGWREMVPGLSGEESLVCTRFQGKRISILLDPETDGLRPQ